MYARRCTKIPADPFIAAEAAARSCALLVGAWDCTTCAAVVGEALHLTKPHYLAVGQITYHPLYFLLHLLE